MTVPRRGRLSRLTVFVTSILAVVGEGITSAEDPVFAAMRVMHVSGFLVSRVRQVMELIAAQQLALWLWRFGRQVR